MDTNTFIWSVIGAIVVAGLGFGAKKIITTTIIKILKFRMVTRILEFINRRMYK